MKKWLIYFLIIVVLVLVNIYLFVPAKIDVVKTIKINCTGAGAMRVILQKNKWVAWWPTSTASNNTASSNTYTHKSTVYVPGFSTTNALLVSLIEAGDTVNSTLTVTALQQDSIAIGWQYQLMTGNNPIKRLTQYLKARSIQQSLVEVLSSLQFFLEKKENVYGLSIQETNIVDSLLITTKGSFTNYPTNVEVYTMIKQLEQYIARQYALQTGSPMLSVQPKDHGYEAMVALPVNKRLLNKDGFVFKQMLGKGRLLVADIKGGYAAIEEGRLQLQNFREDYNKMSPALSFQSLVTNRLQEKDSSQWVTRLCYPIF
jgi:hypothetical protein